MFYHTYILTKRGPFAKIWLAAHWDRKLTKNDVKVIDLSQVVLNIIEPVVPISLRTSGELMLGVVRVYSHKVRILLKESQDAALELVRGRDLHSSATSLTKTKAGVTNEAISAVTYTEPIDEDTMVPSGKRFDKEFAQIENLVMNSNIKPAPAENSIGDEQALINTWFRSGPDGRIDNQQYDPANTFLDFRNEINRDFFHRREDAHSLSDPSKKSSSSGSSIEALRRASVVPPSAEKNRFHIDVGLPVEETADLPEIPDLSMRTPFKLPSFIEEGENTCPEDEVPRIEDQEPPKKKRLVLKQSLVDSGETVISSEEYRKTMKDPRELLSEYYNQGSSFYPSEKLPVLDTTAMLAEEKPWKTFEKLFADELKSGFIVGPKEDDHMEVSRNFPQMHVEEEMVPEFMSNFSPMQHFSETGISDFPMTDAEVASRFDMYERTSGALLANLRKHANTKGIVAFEAVFQAESKKIVAQAFGDLLALVSKGEVKVRQDNPFREILITV